MTTFPIQFGYCLPIFACPGGGLFRTPNYTELDADTTLKLGIEADSLGYDSIWVADHLMLGKDEAIFEGWTTLSALAGATRQAKLGIIHQANFFRQPAVAAKMIATLDQLSGGRFIYFADTGTRASEHYAYGLHYPETMEARMPELLEALELQLALWKTSPEAPLNFNGKYYQVRDAVCTPPPKTQPHPPIWFGEGNPLTLAACARYGQGWNSVPVPMEELHRRLIGLEAACRDAGRSYSDIEKSLETQILIAPTHTAVRDLLRELLALPTPRYVSPQIPRPTEADVAAFIGGKTDDYPHFLGDNFLIGTPDEITARLRTYLEMGFSHFMLWFMDAPRQEGMRLFKQQVAPVF